MVENVLEKMILKKPEGSGTVKVPELLSPAGSFECGRAAILSGADAVYAGLKEGSARAGADNFTFAELGELCRLAHSRGAKVYVAVNITPFGRDEADRFAENAKKAASEGADGVILQDAGLIASVSERRLEGQIRPDFRIHVSTQAGVGTAAGIAFMEALGADRIILPRELTLSEIREIKSRTDAELEIFVHGAMCICYSGSCLLSSHIGGRSGNRGSCAQPCRLQYSLSGGASGPLLSPDDLCALPFLDEVVRSGVSSLKIEGRLKSPEYTALATRIYREALDAAAEGRFRDFVDNELDDALRALQTLFTRSGGGPGFLMGNRGRDHITRSGAGRRGALIGKAFCLSRSDRSVPGNASLEFFSFRLEPRGNGAFSGNGAISGSGAFVLRPGDGVTVTGENGEILCGGTVNSFSPASGETLVCRSAGEPFRAPEKDGAPVYLTSDSRLMKAIARAVDPSSEPVKLPVKMAFRAALGEKAELSVSLLRGKPVTVSVFSEEPVREAAAAPLNEDNIKKQLRKLGGTCLYAYKIDVSLSGNVFIPVSTLNNMRREASEKALKALTGPAKVDGDGCIAALPSTTDACAPPQRTSTAVKPLLSAYLSRNHSPASYLYYEADGFRPETAGCINYLPWELWLDEDRASAVYSAVAEAGGLLIASLPWLPLGSEYGRFQESVRKILPLCHGFRFTGLGDFGLVNGKLKNEALARATGKGLIIAADVSPAAASPGTAEFLWQCGADIITLSPEFPAPLPAGSVPEGVVTEIVDGGPVPLMRMRHCIVGHGAADCSKCDGGRKKFCLSALSGEKYDILTLPDMKLTGETGSDAKSHGAKSGDGRMCGNLILSRSRFEPKAGLRAAGDPGFREFYDSDYPRGVIVRKNVAPDIQESRR